MNIAKYESNYTGHLKIKRLLFLAEFSQNEKEKREAVNRALNELKRGINTAKYQETCEKYKNLDFNIDQEWINRTVQENNKKLQELELEFNTYKTSSLKEKVRRASIELGEFYYRKGEFQNALKRFLRIRDYVSTPQHISEMCLLIIKASLELENYAVISQYLSRARQVCDAGDEVLVAKLTAISGLVDIRNQNWKAAARKFLRVNTKLIGNFNEVVAARDVALYGTVLCMATFPRNEIKLPEHQQGDEKAAEQTLMGNSTFMNFLEHAPVILNFAENFYNAKYAQFLRQLDSVAYEINCDLYMRLHSETLYKKIRNKALIQYVSPYTTVSLTKMAESFEMKVDDLMKDIVALIVSKDIKGKIDSYNMVLYSKVVDQKTKTFETVLEFGESFVKDTENAILRMNVLKHKDFIIQPVKTGKRGGGTKSHD